MPKPIDNRPNVPPDEPKKPKKEKDPFSLSHKINLIAQIIREERKNQPPSLSNKDITQQ